MKLLVALRHGERADRAPTARNVSVQFDPCLTEKGLLQAQQSFERIQTLLKPTQSVHLVSSPFLRCIETASFIAKPLGIPIHIEEGFAELLFRCDFDFCPMSGLNIRSLGADAISKGLGVPLIENQHLPGPKYPESYNTGNIRVKTNWETYFPRVTEDAIIVVSHLFVVGALSEIWLQDEYNIPEDGYCKMTTAKFDGRYHIDLLADHSHAVQ